MDELKKGEKVVADKYGNTRIVKATIGTPKPQAKYFPRPKKAKPILKTPVNSRGTKSNAAASPFYGRSKRS